jgi:hypothetical protein
MACGEPYALLCASGGFQREPGKPRYGNIASAVAYFSVKKQLCRVSVL